MIDEVIAYGFFEGKYPQLVSIEDARSEILEPLTLAQLITRFNKISKTLADKDAELERWKEAKNTAAAWKKNSERNHT